MKAFDILYSILAFLGNILLFLIRFFIKDPKRFVIAIVALFFFSFFRFPEYGNLDVTPREKFLHFKVLESFTGEAKADNMETWENYDTEIGKPLEFGNYLLSIINKYPGIWYDVGKLADAVAMHETVYCTHKNAITANARNNCWGIMTWKNGYRELKTYASIEEGKKDFIRLWSTKYKIFPTRRLAEIYSGKDQSVAWYNNVTKNYREL